MNGGHFLAITNQSGKSTLVPLLPAMDKSINDSDMVVETLDIESEMATGADVSDDDDKIKGKVNESVVKKIP